MNVTSERSYTLRSAGTECGSRIFRGKRLAKGKTYRIEITDNRTRTCKDIPEAEIVVNETSFANPTDEITFYSEWAANTNTPEHFTGTFRKVVGIGGESTGVALVTKSEGTFELVLDANERGQFASGKTALVTGTRTFLSGVETHHRPAIDVSDILVCPAPHSHIDCMPGPNVRLGKECSNTAWIMTNCRDVLITF